MEKIRIKRNSSGDTRTALTGPKPTFEEFHEANVSHAKDVHNVMAKFASDVFERSYNHDITKFLREAEFYKDFCKKLDDPDGFDFIEGDWYKMHIASERHHLNSNCPDDVNLVDVIEMICDCIAAGLARSGGVREINIPDHILRRALNNTITDIINHCEVVDEKEEE